MSTVAATIAEIKGFQEKAHTATWAAMANGDVGAPVAMPGSQIRSIQFDGTYGSGGTVVLEGSNDGTTYFTLRDPQGNALSATSNTLKAVQELPAYIRPKVTAGDGTTSLNARLLLRKA